VRDLHVSKHDIFLRIFVHLCCFYSERISD